MRAGGAGQGAGALVAIPENAEHLEEDEEWVEVRRRAPGAAVREEQVQAGRDRSGERKACGVGRAGRSKTGKGKVRDVVWVGGVWRWIGVEVIKGSSW